MKKIAFTLLVAVSVAGLNSFATDKKPALKAKKAMKCNMGGTCCKKSISKAAMFRAKTVPSKA